MCRHQAKQPKKIRLIDNSGFASSMENNSKSKKNKIKDFNDQMQFKDMHCFIELW